MLTSPDLGMVLSMVEPSSVLSNSESLDRLTGTFLLFLLPLQATGVVPRTQAVAAGQLFPSPAPAPVVTVVQPPQPAGGTPTQDNAVPLVTTTGGQLGPVGAAVVSTQGQAGEDDAAQRVKGHSALGTEVSVVAITPTPLHLQATIGAFGTNAQVQAVATAGSEHTPGSSVAGSVQSVEQPEGG